MSLGDLNRVNTNLQSLTAQFSLNKVNSQLGKNQLQLSTGLRINKAEDDAAGFSIASKLSSRIAGLDQATRNVGDAKSVLDIAETGMNSVMDILIEMKAKAVQAGNETLGTEERGFIGKQIVALADEIDTIAEGTTFQGINLLSGMEDGATPPETVPTKLTFQVGEGSDDTIEVNLALISAGELLLTDDDPAVAFDLSGLDGADTFRDFIASVDGAIEALAGHFNQIGIDQTKLSIREENLSQAISSNSAARSRIQDADFAKVQSESIKLQILQQTATSALAQANMGPQSVLGFLG